MYQQLSASAVSSREVPDTWPTAKVISQDAQVSQMSLAQAWMKASLPLQTMEDGYCCGIIREEVDKLPSEVGGTDLATRAFSASR